MAVPSRPSPDDIAHMRAALALATAWSRHHLAQPVGRLCRRQRWSRGRPCGHRARRPAARRAGGVGHGGRGRAGCDGLCHAGALLPLGPHAALHRCAGQCRCGARGDRHRATRTRGWMARASRSLRAAGIAVDEGVLQDAADDLVAGFRRAGSPGASAGDAEACLHVWMAGSRRGRARAAGSPAKPRAVRPTRCAVGMTR